MNNHGEQPQWLNQYAKLIKYVRNEQPNISYKKVRRVASQRYYDEKQDQISITKKIQDLSIHCSHPPPPPPPPHPSPPPLQLSPLTHIPPPSIIHHCPSIIKQDDNKKEKEKEKTGSCRFHVAPLLTCALEPLHRLRLLLHNGMGENEHGMKIVSKFIPNLKKWIQNNHFELQHFIQHLINFFERCDAKMKSVPCKVLWIYYSKLCHEDIQQFIHGFDTEQKQQQTHHLLKKFI